MAELRDLGRDTKVATTIASEASADRIAIRRLKDRYIAFLDGKRWRQFGALFTSDAVLETTRLETEHLRLEGRAAIVASVRRELESAGTVHRVHKGVIRIVSSQHASAVWSMTDDLDYPIPGGGISKVRGAGRYYEKYRKIRTQWRITRLKLVRTNVVRTTEPGAPP